MKRIVVALCLLAVLLPAVCQASEIFGRAQDQMERTDIEGALAILLKRNDEKFSKTVVSGKDGTFVFRDVDPGTYNIEVVKSGYFKNIVFDLKVERDRSLNVTVRLLKQEGKGGSEYCFMLGSIEVNSITKDIIPEQMVTTRRIESGQIDHMQASSLGDVLSLVPGVEKSKIPGLSEASWVGIRSISPASANSPDQIESFGSAVIIDGSQVLNDANANLKTTENGRSGVDLRTIPAENIKSVEVITGIPSVEYGNFSNGIVKVETKSGTIPPKLNVKINPDTKTMSFTHGINLGKSTFDYHLNYGYSERDLRKIGDEYQRFYIGTNYFKKLFGDCIETKIHSTYTRLLDDEEPTDAWKLKNYNRGYKLTSAFDLVYNHNTNDQFIASFGFDLNRKKYYKEKWVNDTVIDTTFETIFDTTESGIVPIDTMIIDTVAGYIGKLSEIGKEWKWTAKLQRKLKFEAVGQNHQLLTGLELNYSKNTGEGIIIDPSRNYYGLYSMQRSYSFNDYPDLMFLSAYAEDNIVGNIFGKKYDLMFGIRYDMFNPISLNESRNGQFLSPRFNFRYFLTDNFRIRIGAGRSVKAISLGYLFSSPAYYKYVKDSSIVEEKQLQENPNLKAFTSNKYEVSIDWKASDFIGITLTGYFSDSHDRPVGISYPWGYSVNHDTITEASYSLYDNCGWEENSGLEFTLKTKRFYNLEYMMNITYRFEKFGRTGLTYSSSPNADYGETPWYRPSSTWREKVIIDYQLNYISKRLGIWVTLDVQQIPFEHSKKIYHTEPYDYTYTDGQVYTYYQGMTYPWERYLYSYANRWLCNFRLSKSLSESTDLSIYINNVFDDRAVWTNFEGTLSELNPEIYYGMEISTQW